MDKIANLCTSCKFFKPSKDPGFSWSERRSMLEQKYPLLTAVMLDILAGHAELFETRDSVKWGICKYADMPELRDVELDGTKFGCIHHKKK